MSLSKHRSHVCYILTMQMSAQLNQVHVRAPVQISHLDQLFVPIFFTENGVFSIIIIIILCMDVYETDRSFLELVSHCWDASYEELTRLVIMNVPCMHVQ